MLRSVMGRLKSGLSVSRPNECHLEPTAPWGVPCVNIHCVKLVFYLVNMNRQHLW